MAIILVKWVAGAGLVDWLNICFPRLAKACGCSSMAEHQFSKLDTGVRFSSPAQASGGQASEREGFDSPIPLTSPRSSMDRAVAF